MSKKSYLKLLFSFELDSEIKNLKKNRVASCRIFSGAEFDETVRFDRTVLADRMILFDRMVPLPERYGKL